MTHETVFTLEATPIKFGPGASADAGWELKRLGASRVMVVSDPGVIRAGITERVVEAIEAAGIEAVVFDRVRVEPTAESLQEAADFAVDGDFDGFVGVGGGSSLDTAKVADLVATHPAAIMDYVNPPVGEGRKPPGPLQPLLAIPTTAGTGSEATTVGDPRHPGPEDQERHLAPLPAPAPGHRRPGADARPRRRGHLLVRPRRRLPRRRVVRLQALRHARATRVARRPPALPGREPGLGRLVGEGARVRRALPAPRRGRRRRPRGARRDDARRQPGRHRLRLGGRAHPARLRLSDRVAQARIPAARLSRRPSVRAARLVGDRHRAGGVPLHLRGRPGEAPPRGRADRGPRAARRRREHAARDPHRPDARRRRAERRARARLRRGRRLRPGRGRGQAAAPARRSHRARPRSPTSPRSSASRWRTGRRPRSRLVRAS